MSAPLPPNEEELFSRASELPAAERSAYLDQACASDSALRARIEALLRADEAARSFMDEPPAADLVQAATQQAPRARRKKHFSRARSVSMRSSALE